MAIDEDVYCTLVMSDAYLPGAAVLAHSLRDCGTTRKLAVLVTPDTLRHSSIEELRNLYDFVLPIERLATPNPKNLYLMNRADLLFTFTKINLWRQTQFRKIVYIDADVVALRAPDELFDIQETFAAAPDVGWPDAFNSGVMVLSPNMGEYWALKTLAGAGDSFDGADQGLLNQYYEHKPWKRLSFTYNCTPSANYQYEPAYRYYKHKISMVHFIGEDKPWRRARNTSAPPSAHQELSARWWAVYDKHFKVSTNEYTATGRREPVREYSAPARHEPVRAVQAQVTSEPQSTGDVYYATGYPVEIAQGAPPPPEATVNTTELPLTEPGEPAENIQQGIVEPVPTAEVMKFSAPQMEWDATRAAPPALSKPEAYNFPTEVYQFSTDTQPFQPPRSYPEPPKDMWFEIPKEKPRKHEKPPPIFPWEERDVPAPARTFVEDLPPSPEIEPESPPLEVSDEFEVTLSDTDRPVTPTIKVQEEPWAKFGSANKNAWDDVEGIDHYVRALASWQKNRGKPQNAKPEEQKQEQIPSPTKEPDTIELVDTVRKRRESLILTDFPTAIERPSLPVTPAPRRRSTFWGDEREQGMPPAEGVPNQADWDPTAQLDALRRHSLIGPSDLQLPSKKPLPEREMPSSSAPVDPEKLGHPVALTRDAEEGHASESAKGNTAETSRGVSSASEETSASEDGTHEETASTAGGLFSPSESAREVSIATEASQASQNTTHETSTSTIGGSTSAFDFAQGVSFGTKGPLASENIVREKTTSTTGGLTSISDFAQGVSSSTQPPHTSEQTTEERTTSAGGGLFSMPNFTQPAAAKDEEVFSPGETIPGPTTDSAQKPTA